MNLDSNIIPVTKETIEALRYRCVVAIDPENPGSVVIISPAGGNILNLFINGIRIFTSSSIPTVGADGKKGERRFDPQHMGPQAGSGRGEISDSFATDFIAQTGIDPRTLIIPQHGFTSTLFHTSNPEVYKTEDGIVYGASFTLDYPGTKEFPFPFSEQIEVFFENGAFIRTCTIINTGTSTMPVSAGFHDYFHVPGGDEGIDSVKIYNPEEEIFACSQYELPEAEQQEFPLPSYYFVQLPQALVRVTVNHNAANQQGVLNIWTDTMSLTSNSGIKNSKKERYTLGMLEALIKQFEERYGMHYTDEQKEIIIKYYSENRYICVEPVVPGFNALRGAESMPIFLKPGENFSLQERIEIVQS